MAKKLTLDDLKVQSFVTTLTKQESDGLQGGTKLDTNCCTVGVGCGGGRTLLSDCCDTTPAACPDYTIQGATYQECGGCNSALYTDCCSVNDSECCSSPNIC